MRLKPHSAKGRPVASRKYSNGCRPHDPSGSKRLNSRQNRFTAVLDLPDASSQMLQSLFGSLVFNFSCDPVVVTIADVTGNYELQVAKESLDEFKMRILLGQNQRLKPTFSIFLGECQCYPELPEGSLLDDRGSNSWCEVRQEEAEMSPEEPSQVEEALLRGGGDEAASPGHSGQLLELNSGPSVHEDLAVIRSSLIEIPTPKVNTSSGDDTVSGVDNITSRATPPEMSPYFCRAEAIRSACSTQSMILHKKKVSSVLELRKYRSLERLHDTSGRSDGKLDAADNSPPYDTNLDGFIKFLMDNKSARKSGETSQRRIVSGKNVIKYSDGREFIITYEEKSGEDGGVVPPCSVTTSSCTIENSLMEENNDVKVYDSKVFVEEIKKEIANWEAKSGKVVDVEILTSEQPMAPDVPLRAVKSADSVMCNADSLEHFFLELSEEDAKDTSRTISNVKHHTSCSELARGDAVEPESVRSDTFKETTTEPVYKGNLRYDPPIPLDTTSSAEIETMWKTFVQHFHPSQIADARAAPVRATKQEARISRVAAKKDEMTEEDDVAYPGQYSFPYIVEASLRRVNSLLETYRIDRGNQLPCSGEPQRHIVLPTTHYGCLSSTYGSESPNDQATRHIPPYSPIFNERFSSRRCKIFFNPCVSIGDWH